MRLLVWLVSNKETSYFKQIFHVIWQLMSNWPECEAQTLSCIIFLSYTSYPNLYPVALNSLCAASYLVSESKSPTISIFFFHYFFVLSFGFKKTVKKRKSLRNEKKKLVKKEKKSKKRKLRWKPPSTVTTTIIQQCQYLCHHHFSHFLYH